MKKITLLLILLTFNFSLAQIVAPWGQDFNTIEAGGDNSAITDGWYQWSAAEYETNGTDIWYGWSLNPNLAPGSNGEYTLYHDDDVPDTGVVDNYFITPLLDCTQLTEPALRFTEWGTWQSYYYFHGVYYSEDYDGTNAETATWVELAQGAAPTEPTNVEFSIPSSTTAIAWRYGGNYADNWLIDNIEVGEASSGGGSDDCPSPQITSWTMTGDGASFDGTNQSEIVGYQIEYSTSTFTPGDGTATVYEFDSFPHTMTGLDPGTTYYFTIRSICGDDDYSDWSDNGNNGPDPWTTSNCPASYSLPYLNDFNDPASWTTCQTFYDNDGDGNYWFYQAFGDDTSDLSANSASYINGVGALTPDNWVVMGPIDLTNVSDALLEWQVMGLDPNWCQENYTIYVGSSSNYSDLINSSVSFNETITSGGDACGSWANRSLDISDATGELVYIGMRHHDVSDMYYLNIDNVSVTSSTMSNEDFTLQNIDYSFDQETNLLRVTSEEMLSNIQIYNMLGQEVLNQDLNDTSALLNLSSLSSSIYIVNVEGNNSKTKTFKLAIK